MHAPSSAERPYVPMALGWSAAMVKRNPFSALLMAILSAALFLATAVTYASPQDGASSKLFGVVRDSEGHPVADAHVSLMGVGKSEAQATVTDGEGKFSLDFPNRGSYTLRVHKEPYPDRILTVVLPLAIGTPLSISLVPPSGQPMAFSDKPEFTVAGITDWTAAGGHGSDVNLRASESLARETRTLNSATQQAGPDVIPSLEKAHNLNPAEYETSYRLAQAYEEAGQHEKAKTLVQELIVSKSNSNDRADLHRLLGDIDEHSNQPLAAEHEYERAVQLEPSEVNYFAWGSELLEHRAVEAAADVFTKGVRAFPRSERLLAGLGAALYAHGSYEEGAKRVCDASDVNTSDSQPYLFLGKMEQAAPRPLPCAREKLARFVNEHSDNARANYYYAIALLNSDEQANDSTQAETLLQRAVRLDPQFAEAYLQLGVLQAQRGDSANAKKSYEKAAAADPQFPDPHFRLAQIYKRGGEKEKALQELQAFERLKQSEAAAVEQRRHEIRQFVVVMKDSSAPPPR